MTSFLPFVELVVTLSKLATLQELFPILPPELLDEEIEVMPPEEDEVLEDEVVEVMPPEEDKVVEDVLLVVDVQRSCTASIAA